MQRNATNGEAGRVDLPPQQNQGLAALLSGSTITAAAEAAGVDRTTIHRWLREDFSFQAAYNGLRRDLQREMENPAGHPRPRAISCALVRFRLEVRNSQE